MSVCLISDRRVRLVSKAGQKVEEHQRVGLADCEVMDSSARKSLAGMPTRETFAPYIGAVMHVVERDFIDPAVGVVDGRC